MPPVRPTRAKRENRARAGTQIHSRPRGAIPAEPEHLDEIIQALLRWRPLGGAVAANPEGFQFLNDQEYERLTMEEQKSYLKRGIQELERLRRLLQKDDSEK